MNTTLVRKYLQEVYIIYHDDKIVKFVNEFGSMCIMTTQQFESMYEEKG